MVDLQAVVAAANERHTAVVLMLSPRAIQSSGLRYLVGLFTAASVGSEVPLFLQLDHARDMTLIHECLRANFDLIMVDGSRLDFHANAELTRQVVMAAHHVDALVEGQVGRIPGPAANGYVIKEILTEPDSAVRFAKMTGVDMLAVSVGNMHGFTRPKPCLDVDLIATLAERVDVPLVLHGADFLDNSDIRRSIQLGISKVNIGLEIREVYMQALREGLEMSASVYPDHRPILQHIRQRIKGLVAERLSILQVD